MWIRPEPTDRAPSVQRQAQPRLPAHLPQTLVTTRNGPAQDLSSTADTYWVQMQNNATPLAGTAVTISDESPATDRYNLTIVEIVPRR